MTDLDDFSMHIDSFTADNRYFNISLNVGGEPPTIQQVTNCYLNVWHDVDFAYILANALELVQAENTDENSQAYKLLAWLNSLELNGGDIYSSSRFDGFRREFWPNEEFHPLPTVQVLGSEHLNPLETLILVSAASTVMLITSVMWAVRKYLMTRGQRRLLDEQAVLLAKVAAVIGKGNPDVIKAVTPIAKAIIAGAEASAFENENVEIKVVPGVSLSIGGKKSNKSSTRRKL